MSRFFAKFLLVVFLMSNIGMTVSIHYCGGKLSSISIFSFDKHPCKCGKKAMKKDCCRDKVSFLKIKGDVSKTNLLTLKTQFQKLLFTVKNLTRITPLITEDFTQPHLYHPPPIIHKSPIYLLDSVFII